MKKFLLSTAVITVLLCTACSKDRDCVCTYTDVKGETVTLDAQTIKGSKISAKKACEKKDEEWADINGSCKLK
jgi:hypothetical protein